MNSSNNPRLKSFIEVSNSSHFPIQNLPYGVFKKNAGDTARVGVAIGDFVVDLACLEQAGLLTVSGTQTQVFNRPTLNPFIALGPKAWREARETISQLLRCDNPTLRDNDALRQQCLLPMAQVHMQPPVESSGFTDFYSSKEHATNAGIMFRGKENALLPNWTHLPIAYNGRASSIIVSGTDIKRPWGQIKLPQQDTPIFAATQRLDFELEMGFYMGKNSQLGTPIAIADANEYIFGLVLVNDWSARDIQSWEAMPLGPFTSKAFATAVSPWVVTIDALEPFKVAGPEQDPQPFAYLQQAGNNNYDINLEAYIKPYQQSATRVTRTNSKYLYWSMCQQLAQHTVTGCNMKIGDLLATGTISGPEPDSYGCLLELSWNGQNSIMLQDQVTRKYLEDGDEVIMTGWAQGNDYRVGFGTLCNRVLG